MIHQSLLLTSLLLDPTPTDVQREWEPDRGEVSVHDDGLEISAYDSNGELIGTLVMVMPETPEDGAIQIDASFPDAYVSAPLVFFDESQVDAGGLEPTMLTDLPIVEAKHRLDVMFGYAADLGVDLGSVQELSKKECVVAFGMATVVCATATLSANIGIGLACVVGTTTAVCGCTKYVPVKLCP